MIEGKDFIVCKLCNRSFRVLSGHITDAHNIVIREYLMQFPNSQTICTDASEKRQINAQNTLKRRYNILNPMQNKDFAKKCNAARESTLQRKYGVSSSPQIPGVGKKIAKSRINGFIDKFGVPYDPVARKKAIITLKNTIYKKYGVKNSSQVPGSRDRAKNTCLKRYGVLNAMQNTNILIKCFSAGSVSPNKGEKKIIDLKIDNLIFTGNRKLLIETVRERKIPDFIVAPFLQTKKVIEIFGEYHHGKKITGEEPIIHECKIKQLYADIGIDCLVIWYKELKNIDTVLIKIQNFISTKSSNILRDYTPNILYKNDDIVQYL